MVYIEELLSGEQRKSVERMVLGQLFQTEAAMVFCAKLQLVLELLTELVADDCRRAGWSATKATRPVRRFSGRVTAWGWTTWSPETTPGT